MHGETNMPQRSRMVKIFKRIGNRGRSMMLVLMKNAKSDAVVGKITEFANDAKRVM
jgi:hypothetical protein